MKQCPTCHQPFAYELLKFCRFDGSRLVSATAEEAPTLLLPLVQDSGGNEAPAPARKDQTPPAAN